MKDFAYALQHLSAYGVGRDNLYKFFTLGLLERTIVQLGLDVPAEQLSAEWLKFKDKINS